MLWNSSISVRSLFPEQSSRETAVTAANHNVMVKFVPVFHFLLQTRYSSVILVGNEYFVKRPIAHLPRSCARPFLQ